MTVPVYGKLADVLGRKPVMLFGIAVFLVAWLSVRVDRSSATGPAKGGPPLVVQAAPRVG